MEKTNKWKKLLKFLFFCKKAYDIKTWYAYVDLGISVRRKICGPLHIEWPLATYIRLYFILLVFVETDERFFFLFTGASVFRIQPYLTKTNCHFDKLTYMVSEMEYEHGGIFHRKYCTFFLWIFSLLSLACTFVQAFGAISATY